MPRAIRIVKALALALASLVANASVVPTSPEIQAPAHFLQDYQSGQVLAEVNADERREPASLTKMMTAYVVFAELRAGNIKLDDAVLISEKAWRTTGSRMFVEVDHEVPVELLLKGVIIQSGNDASVALAEHVAGDERAFSGMMNQYARRLGLRDSHFVNASGLPHPDHHSTPRDMVTLASALIRDFPDLYRWHEIKEFEYNGIKQYNRNRLLWRDETVDGLKTGYTEAAGYCLVTSAVREGRRLVSVVMGADSEGSRARDTAALLRYGFRAFETHRLYEARMPVTDLRVWQGAVERLDVGVDHDLFVTVPRGQYKRLDAAIEVDARIVAPVMEGSPQGIVRVSLGENRLVERPLIALHEVLPGNLWQQISDSVRLLFQ